MVLNRFNDFQNSNNIYKKYENKSDVNETVKEIKLAAAVAYFNNNTDNKSKKIIEELRQNKSYDELFNQIKGNKLESDILYKILYAERLFNNTWYAECLSNATQKQQHDNVVCEGVETNPDLYKQQHENFVCKNNETKPCVYTQEELLDIRKNISNLAKIGYTTNFHREDIIINSLHESIKKFIDDFHTFIIVSFITGPIVFAFTVKYYSRMQGMKK